MRPGDAGAQPLPRFGTGLRGRFAADQRLARAHARSARLWRNCGGIQHPAANHSRRFRHGSARPLFSAQDSLIAVYTIDDSADFTPTSTNAYSTDVESLREQVASAGRNARLLAEFAQYRARRLFAGGLLLHRRAHTGHAGGQPFRLSRGMPLGAIVVGGSAASNPTAQLSLAGSNNGSNLTVARNLFTYEDRVSFTKGRHQVSMGGWFQRLRSNENLALSQFGQATFTSLQTLLQGTASSLLYDPSPTPLGWRSWFGAGYLEDVIRVTPRLTLSLGFREEFSNGWNEEFGRASTYVFADGVIQTQPHIGNSAFTANHATSLPQPRAGLAWSPFGRKRATVLRAGFGIYNDLQDALGYRTDQNAPFNPTYSAPELRGIAAPHRARHAAALGRANWWPAECSRI